MLLAIPRLVQPDRARFGVKYPDFDPMHLDILDLIRPYSRASPDPSVIQAVIYVARRRIRGAIVECGVWRAGSMMAAAKTLVDYGHWKGMRQATDEFIAATPDFGLLTRIDYTGLVSIKP